MKGKYVFIQHLLGAYHHQALMGVEIKTCFPPSVSLHFGGLKKWALEILLDTHGGHSGWKDSLGKVQRGPRRGGRHAETRRRRRGLRAVPERGWSANRAEG